MDRSGVAGKIEIMADLLEHSYGTLQGLSVGDVRTGTLDAQGALDLVGWVIPLLQEEVESIPLIFATAPEVFREDLALAEPTDWISELVTVQARFRIYRAGFETVAGLHDVLAVSRAVSHFILHLEEQLEILVASTATTYRESAEAVHAGQDVDAEVTIVFEMPADLGDELSEAMGALAARHASEARAGE